MVEWHAGRGGLLARGRRPRRLPGRTREGRRPVARAAVSPL